MDTDVTTLFLEFSRRKLLEQYWPRLRESVVSLTEEQVWGRPNEASNCIGKSLCGKNLGLYRELNKTGRAE
jgi:hypothetical protein